MSKSRKDEITSPAEKDSGHPLQRLTHRTFTGLLWSFSGTGAQAVLKIVTMAVLARLLTPADFGVASTAMMVIGFSEMFSMLGLSPAIIQRPHLESRHIRTGFTTSLMLGLSIAALIWLFTPNIADFFYMPDLTLILRVLVLIFPLDSISVVSRALLKRELQFRQSTAIEFTSYLVAYCLVGIGLAMMNFGVWALVYAALAQAALASIIAFIIQPHSLWPQFELQAFKELIYYSGGSTLSSTFSYLALRGDNFIVGRWLGAEALGLYERAYNLMATSATMFNQASDKVLLSTVAKVQDEPERLAIAFRRGIALIALVTLPISTILIVLAPEMINVLLGPGWDEAIVLFRILAIGMLFRSGYRMIVLVARGTGAVYNLAGRQATYLLLVVIGAWIGQYWGLSGVAWGTLGALLVHYLLMIRLGLKLTSLRWEDIFTAHLPALLLAFVTGTEAMFIAMSLRELHIPAVVTLTISIVVIIMTISVLLCLAPKLILGPDGLWVIRILLNYIPDKVIWLSWLKRSIQSRLKYA